jgi:phosphohistidine swiveling domain-containing protein
MEYVLPLADDRATLQRCGGKGASLARLASAGLPVPDGFHVTTSAYASFVADNALVDVIATALAAVDPTRPATLEAASERIRERFAQGTIPPVVANAIVEAYATLPGTDPAVAVRSSATAEDLPEASFAGQQETYLDISGGDALLTATRDCWASLWTARAIGYRARQGIPSEHVALAVVVQVLVPAESAGVLFTAHPLTGRRDQVMISAAWGLGESIVSGTVTPDTVVVDRQRGQVVSRQTGDKALMTVRGDGGARVDEVPEDLRRASVLDDEAARELTRLGTRIEALYGTPMDVEWARSDGRFAILQARPITALPPADAGPPDEWHLPAGAYVAMRNNIVELMPDPLSPLFATLGLQAVNAALQRIIGAFFGRSGAVPEPLIVVVNGYAYYNGSLSAGQMAHVLFGSVGIARRMFSGAVARWTDHGRPRYVATVDGWRSRQWRQLPGPEILSAVRELTEAAVDAYGALLSGVIPAAWITEGAFTLVSNLVVRSDVPARTYLLGFDSIPIRSEKSLYDIAQWARGHEPLADHIRRTPAARLADELTDQRPPDGVEPGVWRGWQTRVRSHLEMYGGTIYNLDFADPVPADEPTPLLETCKLYLRGGGVDPHARQRATVERREMATQRTTTRLGPVRRALFRGSLARAQRFAPLREDGLAEVGLAYPLLRRMLLELGRKLVEQGLIDQPGDIFWLQQSEVEAAMHAENRARTGESKAALVQQRRAGWRAAARLTPPFSLVRLLGFEYAQRPKTERADGERLTGVACSPGTVTGPARVLRGPEDFGQMQPGDVLVARITTPAWTPLFAMASAIVTDVGGPLSHGSIVAREYGIPAVLGTGAATTRLRTGQAITVDGDAGVVVPAAATTPATAPIRA